MTHMVLPAEEHREDTHSLARFIDVEPIQRPTDGEMPQAGQEVVMAFAVGSGLVLGGLAKMTGAETPKVRAKKAEPVKKRSKRA